MVFAQSEASVTPQSEPYLSLLMEGLAGGGGGGVEGSMVHVPTQCIIFFFNILML